MTDEEIIMGALQHLQYNTDKNPNINNVLDGTIPQAFVDKVVDYFDSFEPPALLKRFVALATTGPDGPLSTTDRKHALMVLNRQMAKNPRFVVLMERLHTWKLTRPSPPKE